MRSLDSGSLIVFGGTVDQTFYLDTVFVVGERTPYIGPDKAQGVQCSTVYRILSLDQTKGKLSFYKGVTWAQKECHDELYSFVPGKVLQDRFALNTMPLPLRNRCGLDFGVLGNLNQLIGEEFFTSDNSKVRISNNLDSAVVKSVWKELLTQVRTKEFVPCVRFPWPQ